MTPLADRPTPITDAALERAAPVLTATCMRLEQALAATVEALEMALRQNEHDMLLSGDERHQVSSVLAAVAAHVKGE